jgi:tetratricopeptide (TPR) repeat protein
MAFGVARIAALALLLALAGCGSAQEKAAKAAARFDELYAKRDFYGARIEIKRAIAKQDDVSEYWQRLGRVQMALGRYLDAYQAYNHVIELDPHNKEAIEQMAELAYTGQSFDDSEKFADQILAEQPRSLRMLLVKGSIAAARQDAGAARATAENMLSIDPTNEGGTILLARALRLQGDRAGAIATLERSVAKDGETVGKLGALLDLYVGRDDFRKIAYCFARLFTLEPDDVDLRLDYVKILYEQGLPDRALAMLARLTHRHPGDSDLEQRIVDIWNESGSAAVDVDLVRRFVLSSGDEPMKIALGHLLLQQKRYTDAAAVLRPFIDTGDITAANVEADVLYAGTLAGLGRGAEAQALIDRILDFDVNNPRALLMRVRISTARGDLVQALRDAQLLVRDNPDMAEGRIALANIYVRRKEHVLADDAYARAMVELPDDSAMLAAFIGYEVQYGRATMALDAAKRFTRENPIKRDGWRQRAELCIQLEQGDCVAESFNALDQLPGGPKIRRVLEPQWNVRKGAMRQPVKSAVTGQAPASCGRTDASC